MAKAALTAKYRPQSFKEMVGQDSIKKTLSRASELEKPANAYLFSGTRGVGKTTAARILAKAINCLNGPAPEPCNQCTHCSNITRGIFSDVMEIDGASHTGVDHVRKLREDVMFVPVSGKYRVIIIDEAHMLSKSAFNALLKTLEEPPGHCVFIMATTAPEQFPPTVVSRCQHFVFKMVPLDLLCAHLKSVLDAEGIGYDPEAVNIIARRGAGSVRDSMSILGQVVVLSGERIEPAAVRESLGLAGHDVYAGFFRSILNKDLPAIHKRLSAILGQGLDINYFLQEFAACWRNIFILSQSGKAGAKVIDLPAEELEFWVEIAGKIPGPIIHAGWQMVIEEQKGILKSNEPALALELLFFNLAYLPDLLPVGEYNLPASSKSEDSQEQKGPEEPLKKKTSEPEPGALIPEQAGVADVSQEVQPAKEIADQARTWEGFIEFCRNENRLDEPLTRMLDNCTARHSENSLELVCSQGFIFDSLQKNGREGQIASMVREYFGQETTMKIVDECPKNDSAFKERALNHPAVKKVITDFDARIMEITRI